MLFKHHDLKEQTFESSTIKTTFDSAVYRDFHRQKRGSRVVALDLFADGVCLQKKSFYTLIVKVNDLDSDVHAKTLLNGAALSAKPNLRQFLGPLVEEANELWKNGVYAERYGETVYPYIHTVLLDGKARPEMMEMSQFNSARFCTGCYVEGEQFRTDAGGTARYFVHGEHLTPRTHEDSKAVACAIEAGLIPSSERRLGIKGKSLLYEIKYLNLVHQVPPMEPMHSIIGGYVKRDLESMMTSANKHLDCFIPPSLRQVLQRRLNLIRVNSNFKRSLGAIEKTSIWKTNQHADFFFYIGPVVFDSILKDTVYEHYLQLVYLITRVWCGGIESMEIDNLRRLVENYLSDHKNLYPLRDQTSNLHSMNHLIDTFIYLGPFKDHNGFPFEAINGECSSIVTGPRFVMEQIASRTELNLLIATAAGNEPKDREFKLSGGQLVKNSLRVNSASKQIRSSSSDYIVWTTNNECFEIKRHFADGDKLMCEAVRIRLNGNLEVTCLGMRLKIEHIYMAQIETTTCIFDAQTITEKVIFVPAFTPQHSSFEDVRTGFIVRQTIPFHN